MLFRYILILILLLSFAASKATEKQLFNSNSEHYYHDRIVVKALPDKEVPGIDVKNNIEKLEEMLKAKGSKNTFSSSYKGTPFEKLSLERVYTVFFDSEIDVYQKIDVAIKSGLVEIAEPKFKRFLNYTPNDTDYNEIDDLLRTINMEEAWDITRGNPEIKIAIIDSGTDTDHGDLEDNIYINPNEIPDNGIDDDENGLIDDISGWDMAGDLNSQEVLDEEWEPDNDPRPNTASNNHGTHVAGIAAATGDNNRGIPGIAFQSKIIPIKASVDDYTALSIGVSQIVREDEAMMYAAMMGADVINCSWGGLGYSQISKDIIDVINDSYGAIIVAAAGNESENINVDPYFPASYDRVIAVGSSTQTGFRNVTSSYGDDVDVFAPGLNYYSTEFGNTYGRRSGTSMASPVVAGVVALMLDIYPELTVEQVKYLLRTTSLTVPDNLQDIRLMDAEAALLRLDNPDNNLFFISDAGFEVRNFPDIEDSQIRVEDSEVNIRLKYKNNLFQIDGANAIDYEIIVNSEYLEILSGEVSGQISNIDANDEFNFEITVLLDENNPWFFEENEFKTVFSNETITDTIIHTIEQNIPTDNSYAELVGFTENEEIRFYSIDAVDSTAWLAGYTDVFESGVAFRYTLNGTDEGEEQAYIYSDSTLKIAAVNDNLAYALTRSGNSYNIKKFGTNQILSESIFDFSGVTPISISEESTNLYVLVREGLDTYNILKFQNDDLIETYSPPFENIGSVCRDCFLVNGNIILTAGTENTASYNLENQITVFYLIDENYDVQSVDLSEDGDYLHMITSEANSTKYRQFSSKEGAVVDSLSDFTFTPTQVIAEPISNRAIFYDGQGRILVRDELLEGEYLTKKELTVDAGNILKMATIPFDKFNTKLFISGKDLNALNIFRGGAPPKFGLGHLGNIINFDTTFVNETKTFEYKLYNTGRNDLTIVNAELTDPAGMFNIEEFEQTTLSYLDTLKFDIDFSPTVFGNFDALVSVDIPELFGNHEINLSGVGINPVSVLTKDNSDSIFPNPVKDLLHIGIDNVKHIEITNLVGDVVYSEDVRNIGVKLINMSKFQPGVYVLKVFIKDKFNTYKVIKE